MLKRLIWVLAVRILLASSSLGREKTQALTSPPMWDEASTPFKQVIAPTRTTLEHMISPPTTHLNMHLTWTVPAPSHTPGTPTENVTSLDMGYMTGLPMRNTPSQCIFLNNLKDVLKMGLHA